ncbi:MAG: hypothetical protein ACUVV5_06200 [Candidatus Aminicenantales bacterium]
MDVSFEFVNYGTVYSPQAGVMVLDVGMKTVPGVIDHHHPEAEPECTASLIVKYPHLVLNHFQGQGRRESAGEEAHLRIITHRLPDFDALSSIFLVLKLIEIRKVDTSMEKIAGYAKMVDSASLPRDIDLTATPYSILRALFAGVKRQEAEINRERVEEGLKFMRFLYAKAEEGYEIIENRRLFAGIDRYEKAMRKIEDDYFHYLDDVRKGQKLQLNLPLASGQGKKKVEGLIVRNPSSFLLKEWARRDINHTTDGQGFAFLMTNFANQRYILGVDPARDINLKGLGSLLNLREESKRTSWGRPVDFRWYEGNCPFFNYRIIDSPQDGTSLSHEEIVEILIDFGLDLQPPTL